MKININFFLILFGLFTLAFSDKETRIKIVTTKEEEQQEEEIPSDTSEDTSLPGTDQTKEKKRDNAQSETEKMIQDAKKNSKETSLEKSLTLVVPFQDNEDFILSPLGIGTPVNFSPVQVETTSFKSWVSSVLNKKNPSIFAYNIKESKTGEETGDWDSVIDNEGTISGNAIYDTAYIGKYKLPKFKFIEAVEFDDNFKDFQNGKLGLGNCHYADESDKEYCLIQKLKDNGSIERRLFSIRELSDTHGELVIGDVTPNSKENDYPLLSVIKENEYEDIEDDEFKMSWITKVSHIIFKNSTSDKVKNIFKNNIYIKEGLASFDSSSHYIEAPYSYINDFQEQMFDKFYPNVCRKVNNDGTYMFLCNKERFDEIKNYNKDLSFIIVMDGNGFEIPMDFLFEQTRENDYEFFVHFKDYEQNIWNLGHPFFHHFTIIFDLDNQEIGVDGQNIYNLKDETEAVLRNKGGFGWWKIFLLILVGLLLLVGVFWLLRKYGIQIKLDNGTSPSLVDNESVDDLSFGPSQNVH